MGQGAFDFLEKPCAPEHLVSVLQRALSTRRLVLENRRLKAQLETGDPAARMIFGTSRLAEELRARVRTVARTGTEVLVTGPPGAGVPKVAEVIHLMSPVAAGPLRQAPRGGMEPARWPRRCARARAAACFSTRSGALPDATQYALLERLEQGAEARLIAGSTADLGAEAAAGGMNAELYYRLDVTPVRIPPCRSGPRTSPCCSAITWRRPPSRPGLPAPEVTTDHMARLMAQDWPGNARR